MIVTFLQQVELIIRTTKLVNPKIILEKTQSPFIRCNTNDKQTT